MTSLLLLALLACQPGATSPDGDGATDGDEGGEESGATDGGGGTDSAGTDGGGEDSGTDGGGEETGATDTGTVEDPRLVVVINELMADNEGIVTDPGAAEGEDDADWIELYNPGSVDADLSGCGISDDWSDPFQYRLPEGTVVPAGGHLLLWASGESLPSGDRLPQRLSADGESIGLFTPDGASIDWVGFPSQDEDTARARLPDGGDDWVEMPRGTPGSENLRLAIVEEEVVSSGDLTRFWDQGTHPGDDWTLRSYDDSAWGSGPSPLGYGDSDLATTISYGPDSSNKHAAAWFRTTFPVPDGEGTVTGGSIAVRFDDGIAVWLDGSELLRDSLPTGELTADTWATATKSGSGETAWTTVDLQARELETGEAVLAAEVHQVQAASSDTRYEAVLTLERIVVVDEE